MALPVVFVPTIHISRMLRCYFELNESPASSVRAGEYKYNVLRVVFFLRPSTINDAALSDMALFPDKSRLSTLKVLFLCSISVSAGPFSSVILSSQCLSYV